MEYKDLNWFNAAVRGENTTKWSKLIADTTIVYLLSFSASIIPAKGFFAILLFVNALAFLGIWLSLPYTLYKDRKYVAEHTDWRPSKWYYLGFLPGFLGLGALLYYLYKRRRAFRE